MMTIFGLFIVLIGWAAGVIRYKNIVKKYRNADARYRPELEAAYTPLALRQEDVKSTARPKRTGRTIDRGNHTTHAVRAAYYRAMVLDTPPPPDPSALPPASPDAAADTDPTAAA